MFAVDFCPIFKFSLEGLTKNRVEWFQLTATQVDYADHRSNHVFKSLSGICGF